jgi:hypothetical protein
MAEVTGFTSARMREIEDTTVVDGEIQGDNLILLTREGTPIDAGVVRGPQGSQGPAGPVQSVNDQLGAVYAPRIFASKAVLDTDWGTSPNGAHAYTILEQSGWVKHGGTWKSAPGITFPNKAALVAGWVNAPENARAFTTEERIDWVRSQGSWLPGPGMFRVFASIAERNTHWPTPPVGAEAYTIDGRITWERHPDGWRQKGPAGFVTQAFLTANVGPYTWQGAAAEIHPNLYVDLGAWPGKRALFFSAEINSIWSDASNGALDFGIQTSENGGAWRVVSWMRLQWYGPGNVASPGGTTHMYTNPGPLSSLRYRMFAQQIYPGAAFFTLGGSDGSPMFMSITDLGPVPL